MLGSFERKADLQQRLCLLAKRSALADEYLIKQNERRIWTCRSSRELLVIVVTNSTISQNPKFEFICRQPYQDQNSLLAALPRRHSQAYALHRFEGAIMSHMQHVAAVMSIVTESTWVCNMGSKPKPRHTPGACLFHDRVNLICLPILAAMSVAGLMGWYNPVKVYSLLQWTKDLR